MLAGAPVVLGTLAKPVPVSAQSELGRGSGASVAYPYGPSRGPGGVYSNANVSVAGTASGGRRRDQCDRDVRRTRTRSPR